MISACIQQIKLVNLASDPVEFPVKILYRRRVALLEFVEQKSETQKVEILTARAFRYFEKERVKKFLYFLNLFII